ncbi:hypothetical protein RHGRI_007152 [Rhododendron griersonianum]|uniref:Uncharacterized protein n=1 Tax=Rhododendron griersonianum TaxID=479676 RepID=A0AAV6KXI5_9ERIC|nr:hypothetical protein RHGRI_007152 [Rhododendron griersonianum]
MSSSYSDYEVDCGADSDLSFFTQSIRIGVRGCRKGLLVPPSNICSFSTKGTIASNMDAICRRKTKSKGSDSNEENLSTKELALQQAFDQVLLSCIATTQLYRLGSLTPWACSEDIWSQSFWENNPCSPCNCRSTEARRIGLGITSFALSGSNAAFHVYVTNEWATFSVMKLT